MILTYNIGYDAATQKLVSSNLWLDGQPYKEGENKEYDEKVRRSIEQNVGRLEKESDGSFDPLIEQRKLLEMAHSFVMEVV